MFFQSQRDGAVFDAWAEQSLSDFEESAQMGFAGIDRMEGKVVLRRFVRDNLRRIYASYTVTVETLPQEGMYRVSFGPPSEQVPADLRGKADWRLVSPAKYPAPQILKDENEIRLDLYSDGTSRRVVDYIHVGRQDRIVMRKESPHEYYADDAECTVTQPRFLINGVACKAIPAMPETIRGPVLWIYIPGEGRYVLSFHPHSDLGFEGSGEVAGGSLTFTAGRNLVRVNAVERIATGSGTYTVNVFPDLAWEPTDPSDRKRVVIGTALGSDAVESETGR
jgi:hypothetical protein